MLEKLGQGQRIVIASIVSIFFFLGYEFIFGKELRKAEANKTVQSQTIQSQQAQNQSSAKSEINTTSKNQNTPAITSLTSDGFYTVGISQNGTIKKFDLLEKKFTSHDGKPLELFNTDIHEAPLGIRFIDQKLNEESSKVPFSVTTSSNKIEANGTNVVLTQTLNDLNITKNIKFFKDGKYEMTISMSKDVPFYVSPGYRPTVHTDMMTLAGVVLVHDDDRIKTIEDGGSKVEEKYNDVVAVASEDHYYVTAMYSFDKAFELAVTGDNDKNPTPFITGHNNMKIGGYIGPKNTDTLASINPKLVNIVEYGYLTFMAKPMFDVLSWIESKIGNWGWAIVIMTILVRAILFPLTLKGMVSMNRMKELAPKMQELKEKYKGDAQKLNMHMLELYKKHNANPLSGCLPLILQIPIFFALYKVLLGSVELKGAEWILWINDLSEKDPYFILPILMGVTMFLQQKITPMNVSDPMQEKILKYLPVVFTVFFVTFPAGLTLYWFVSNVLSVIQQYVVNQVLAKQKREHHHG